MNHTNIDTILLLRDTNKETFFSETDLHVITATFLITGALLNVLLIFLSITRIHQGVTPNITSIAFLDILNLVILLPEINYVNNRNWKFSQKLCTVYLGAECIINICILYISIVTNVQVISTINGLKSHIQSKGHSNDTYNSFEESDELDDEGYQMLNGTYNENEVMKPASSDDIYVPNGSFSVLLLFVISLAVSVSIPFFLYAQKDRILGTTTSICVMEGLDDPVFNTAVAFLLIFVRVLLPTILLIGTSVLLSINHFKASHETYLLRKPIKIALTLSIIVIICSLQRVYGSLLIEIYGTQRIGNISGSINKPFTPQFKYPHVDNNLIAILLTLMHYLSSLVRPFSILMIQYCCCCGGKQQIPTKQ